MMISGNGYLAVLKNLSDAHIRRLTPAKVSVIDLKLTETHFLSADKASQTVGGFTRVACPDVAKSQKHF